MPSMHLWCEGGGEGIGEGSPRCCFSTILHVLEYRVCCLIMDCFLSVTTASQSEPVLFAEHSIDVCKQIQAWQNSQ